MKLLAGLPTQVVKVFLDFHSCLQTPATSRTSVTYIENEREISRNFLIRELIRFYSAEGIRKKLRSDLIFFKCVSFPLSSIEGLMDESHLQPRYLIHNSPKHAE